MRDLRNCLRHRFTELNVKVVWAIAKQMVALEDKFDYFKERCDPLSLNLKNLFIEPSEEDFASKCLDLKKAIADNKSFPEKAMLISDLGIFSEGIFRTLGNSFAHDWIIPEVLDEEMIQSHLSHFINKRP